MIEAAVIGATGFTGVVLTEILQAHPEARPAVLTSTSYEGRRASEAFPSLRHEGRYVGYSLEAVRGTDVAFVCYPHGEAHPVVAELREAGIPVIDLSADFRLPAAEYPAWYGFEHPRPDLVGEAVYGLPELHRERIRDARLVANPGCFPTGALLGLTPLAGLMDFDLAIVDAKSGVSGAGRSPSAKTHFSTVHDNFRSYTEVGHRHTVEMSLGISAAAGASVAVAFTPHLLPVDRGILGTMYVRPAGGVPSESQLLERYREFYAGEPFVEVREHPPALDEVRYTNSCRLAVRVDEGAGIVKVVTAIDNLVKGASGQAVQNMNLMFGLPEESGLEGRL